MDHTFDAKIASCLVNPLAAHETELLIKPGNRIDALITSPFTFLVSPDQRQKVAIVGAGPAGLACAVTAARKFLISRL